MVKIKNLILDTKTLDDKNAIHGEKSDFLGQLIEKIRGCGVSFYIWTKKCSQGELDPKAKKSFTHPLHFSKISSMLVNSCISNFTKRYKFKNELQILTV
jgi:hypothetical protein